METTELDLSGFDDDGNVLELEDGSELRVRFEQDDQGINNLRDHGDCWGDTEWFDDRPYGDYVGQRRERPSGFDGNAEKLHVGQGYSACWWQPPEDVPRSSEHFAELRQNVKDLLEYGFQGIILEHVRDMDAYSRGIVVNVASLWGIEPFPTREYRAEVIRDLVDEVLSEE